MAEGRELLRDRLGEHLRLVRGAAEDNEFIDLARAEELHDELAAVVARYDELDDDRRTILIEAIAYLVRTDDEEDDLRSPIGLEDDAEVVEAALRRLRPQSSG